MKTINIEVAFNVPDDIFISEDTMVKEFYTLLENSLIKFMGSLDALKFTSDPLAHMSVTYMNRETIPLKELVLFECSPDLLDKDRANQIRELISRCARKEAVYFIDLLTEIRHIEWMETKLLQCEGGEQNGTEKEQD